MSHTNHMPCIFCQIVAREAPASVVHEDDVVMSFMTIRPTAPGECVVIPKAHVDHFTDVDDATAQHIMRIAQRIGRRMREVFSPLRVGMVVHGFGVAHAHLILVPQHGIHHITSDRYVTLEDGRLVFTQQNLPTVTRPELDAHARRLADF